MVLCRFYQQGTCRYGNNCKYDHQLPGDYRYVNSTSILLRNVQPQQQSSLFQPQASVFQQQQQQQSQQLLFQQPQLQQLHQQPQQQLHQQPQQLHHQQQQQQQQQHNTNIDVNILIKSVVNDMITAEKGGQWLLSSYAPFKEKPPYPGFVDYSMEEIRYMFYEAVKNNTLQQYKYNLQLLLQQAMMKNKTLQNPTPDIINALKQIYNSQQQQQQSNEKLTTAFQQNSFSKEIQQQYFNSDMSTKPQKPIFPAQQSQFTFNQQQQQQQQQQNSIFQQNFNGGFIQPDVTNSAQQQSANFFNQTNNNQKYNDDFYSKLDELNDDDKNWFNNDDIDDLDKIPEKPPTYEMCF